MQLSIWTVGLGGGNDRKRSRQRRDILDQSVPRIPRSGGREGILGVVRPTRDIDGYPSAGAGVTDNNGRATLTLTVNDGPPSRTSQPDGLLYFIVRYLGAEPPDLMQAAPRQESMISAVVYAPFPYSNPPAWETVKRN